MEAEGAVVCRRCCGEVYSATSVEAAEAAGGAAADLVVAALEAAVVVDLVEVSVEAATLAAEVRVAVGKISRIISAEFVAEI